ncbi:MAG TPA: hypothetical protein ENN72_00555 [Firmicutes bacterium]|nr:hypothetical protein [Bacillota bacterium]
MILFPLGGYAEVHHRRGKLPNLLWQNEPEIFCDFPRRVEPGVKIFPVIVSVKDAHLYPVFIVEITLKFLFAKRKHEESLFKGKMLINHSLKQFLFEVSLPEQASGDVPVAVEIRYFLGGREKVMTNHNYQKITRELWTCYFAEESRPLFSNWYAGDIHWHSAASSDDVEFGLDAELAYAPAVAMGLHFLAVTDHSYDLDDTYQNHRESDPELHKWNDLQRSIDRANQKRVDFTLIRGEEASLGNDKGRNVHALILGNRKFVPGSGDSAEVSFKNRPDNTLRDAVEEGYELIAAHPFEGAHLLPYFFLRRGTWTNKDWEKASGIEFYNGVKGAGFEKGKKKWVELLLRGRKIFTYGGSDAHGDFIRYFKIQVPFLKMGSSRDHLTGKVQTHVKCQKIPNETILLENLKKGHCYVTDGPALDMAVEGFPGLCMGDTISVGEGEPVIDVKALSTKEFGTLSSLVIFAGNRETGKEEILAANTEKGFSLELHARVEKDFFYFRAEAETETGHIAFSNPIFIDN